jgi:hypothetical protein
MTFVALRPVTIAAMALLFAGVVLTPAATAQSQPPRANELLQASISAMKQSLHQVHTVGYDSIVQGNKVYPLRMTADCIMRPQVLRGYFRVWGTQPAVRNRTRARAYNKQFILFLSRTRSGRPHGTSWVRDALKSNTWRRTSSAGNVEAFQFITLCVAFPLVIDVLGTILPKSLTSLGATHTAGYTTWHLRNARLSGTGRPTRTLYNDFYIDQVTHYLVRTRVNLDDGRSYQVRTFSKFNAPLTIVAPR